MYALIRAQQRTTPARTGPLVCLWGSFFFLMERRGKRLQRRHRVDSSSPSYFFTHSVCWSSGQAIRPAIFYEVWFCFTENPFRRKQNEFLSPTGVVPVVLNESLRCCFGCHVPSLFCFVFVTPTKPTFCSKYSESHGQGGGSGTNIKSQIMGLLVGTSLQ